MLDHDITLELDCDCCGAHPPGRAGKFTRRHETTRPDPERPGVLIVLCDRCAQADPGRVAELVRLRRRWFVLAWRAGLRPVN